MVQTVRWSTCVFDYGVFLCVCPQGISVVEQEQLDNTMIEMDGTENKCESKHDGREWTNEPTSGDNDD